ncbi:peptidase S8/S53 domain-containing protein [Apiosordaria backusii]|uniref:Peptidase S8/S53 domain-containing protein n=1 Tax=Apiosordaria backusii TaxID=314023 RepID=A0AA40ESS5_9PEZI|nr:peptidase S8/S53 domain-containing protein [Apiosordaria backusii]
MQLLWTTLLLPTLALAAPVKEAPLLTPRGAAASQLIDGSYIVKLKDGSSDATLQGAIKGLSTQHLYKAGRFKGFAAKLSAAKLAAIRKLPEVEYIEQDAVVQAYDFVTQEDVPWGLARISHRTAGQTSYVYDSSAGEGTCSYIIDTGVYVNHTQFGNRAEWLANFIDTDNTDGNGHGTHVAGTIGGLDYGVAKKTRLFGVKVLRASGSGTLAAVIAGIDFVAADHTTRGCPKGATANLSLGASRSTAVNAAAAAAVRAGVFLSVAAGNSADDSFFYSPASEETVCTVGATDEVDVRAWFSNYGELVDVFAPGVAVLSSWIGNPTATNTISGTSMAAPHVAGLASYLLGLLPGPKTPAELCTYIRDTATNGTITDLPAGTFNGIAFNGNPNAL